MTTLQGKDFNRGEVKKTLLKYVLSSVAAMWVFTLYTMVDGMFVARGVGPDALVCGKPVDAADQYIFWNQYSVCNWSKYESLHLQRKREEYDKASHVFTMSTITVFVLSLIVTVICLLNLDTVSDILGATPQTKEYVMDYLRIILLFDVCYMTAYNLEVLVKADGYPQKAIFTPLIGAVSEYRFRLCFYYALPLGYQGRGMGNRYFTAGYTDNFHAKISCQENQDSSL